MLPIISEPRLVLFPSLEEYQTVCAEAQRSCKDPYTLGASWRLGVSYSQVSAAERSLMKLTFMRAAYCNPS